jgi:hypothetical protein
MSCMEPKRLASVNASLRKIFGGVDHLFQLGVNVVYHEDMYLVVQQV